MLLSGDDLTKISPERLAILKKLTPPRGKPAQFGDDSFTQGIEKLHGHTMIVVFDWSDQPENRTVLQVRMSRVKDYRSDEDLGIHERAFGTIRTPTGNLEGRLATAWAKSKSLDEVVKETGLAKLSVQARAHRLRKAGVRLPKFTRQKVTDVVGLNDLLGTLLGKTAKKKRA